MLWAVESKLLDFFFLFLKNILSMLQKDQYKHCILFSVNTVGLIFVCCCSKTMRR